MNYGPLASDYADATCRGSISLGSACLWCSRCRAELSRMQTEKTYIAHATCRNCSRSGEIPLVRGVQITESPCPNCGCMTLEPKTAVSEAK